MRCLDSHKPAQAMDASLPREAPALHADDHREEPSIPNQTFSSANQMLPAPKMAAKNHIPDKQMPIPKKPRDTEGSEQRPYGESKSLFNSVNPWNSLWHSPFFSLSFVGGIIKSRNILKYLFKKELKITCQSRVCAYNPLRSGQRGCQPL